MRKTRIISIFLYLSTILITGHTQENTLKEQKIKEELETITLPELPENKESLSKESQKITQTPPLNINSSEVIKKEKSLQNEGKPYFTLSGGLAPFQASIGILKYFIPEWWGHLEINLTFIPSSPVNNYYTAISSYNPYVAFKVITGYSFYTYKNFELSLIAQIQLAFISSSDIPIIPALGFRITISFFYIDIGVAYAFGINQANTKPLFSEWHPAIVLGFRF